MYICICYLVLISSGFQKLVTVSVILLVANSSISHTTFLLDTGMSMGGDGVCVGREWADESTIVK